MNAQSSRSHTIFSLILESKKKDSNGKYPNSQLNHVESSRPKSRSAIYQAQKN
jgi:hypothetical protein